ncbi:hypothetical protein [Ferrovibrio xuzhouensis]|uniref:Uncharacterized protein n=1 Tax=Ferrovibrio xuzhouensis TaxID=1576914 RepID=A0ABV7VD00_9PROT
MPAPSPRPGHLRGARGARSTKPAAGKIGAAAAAAEDKDDDKNQTDGTAAEGDDKDQTDGTAAEGDDKDQDAAAEDDDGEDAEDAAEDEDDDADKPKAKAAAAERTRIRSILTHEAAAGRESLAQHFAFGTGLSAKAAIAALAAAPKGTAKGALGIAMAGLGTPKVGASAGGGATDSEAAAVQRIAAYAGGRR